MNRRMFLSGAGATVTIPTLVSLRPAHAASLPTTKRFVAMATEHGGIWGQHMWPGEGLLTETTNIGHTIRRGDLVSSSSGSQTVLSDVLTADSARLTPTLVAQMNLLRGLDVPFYLSHHTGGYLGNFGRNNQEFDGGSLPYIPTIDQLMAWSDGFHGDMAGVVQRSVHIGDRMSYGWSNPTAGQGSVDAMPGESSSLQLFDSLFPNGGEPEGPPRRLVVDQVLESYQRLRDGAFGASKRLSAGDRQRLDEHIERLYEVERKLLALPTCDEVDRPTEDTNGHPGRSSSSLDLAETNDYHQLWNEVLALGLICGATRIATFYCGHNNEPYSGDWHQEVAHEAWVSETAEQHLINGQRLFFDEVFCDLCTRLDVPDSDGNTVLHNSLVVWNQESGPMTHDAISLPVITAGSAGGAIPTGQYVDYRNRNSMDLIESWQDNAIQQEQRPGLLFGQFLASCLQAMDVERSTWETPGNPGYGVHDNQNPDAYPAYVEAMANDVLPFLSLI